MYRLSSSAAISLISLFVLLIAAGCGVRAIPGQSSNAPGSSSPGSSSPAPEPTPAPTKSTPVITWPDPSAVTNPAPLSAAQLDATANIPGSFAYAPAAGTVLAPGTQTLTTSFTPTDTADYNSVTASVTIEVNPPLAPPPADSGCDAHLAVADPGNGRLLLYPLPFTTNENACLVLGQPDFDHNSFSSQSAANTLQPSAITEDGAGDLFVADTAGCRVIEFQPPFTNNMDASIVIGQPQLTGPSSANGTASCISNGPSGMNSPAALAIDRDGNLWVADNQDGRVTEYTPPFTSGMAASLVIGQQDLNAHAFCNGSSAPSTPSGTATLCAPAALAFDPNGDLWIGDSQNSRVLEYAPPFKTGMSATLVLGQPSTPTTSVGFPSALAFDANGNLWVADSWNYRVVEFTAPFSSGMSATLAIGQPNFTTTAPGTLNFQATPSNLNGPDGLAFDSSGDLIVSTNANSRVLIFAPPFKTGMSASRVIGEPSLTSGDYDNCAATAPNSLCHPQGILTF